MKRLAMLTLLISTAAFAGKDDCKVQCAGVRGPCASACEDASKSKKQTADCAKKMCDMAVQQCEAQCGAGNAKKR